MDNFILDLSADLWHIWHFCPNSERFGWLWNLHSFCALHWNSFWWLELLFIYIAAISCLGISRLFRTVVDLEIKLIMDCTWDRRCLHMTLLSGIRHGCAALASERLELLSSLSSLSETDSTSLFETSVCRTCNFIWVKIIDLKLFLIIKFVCLHYRWNLRALYN